ncbi:hypothetical protein HAX54_021262 [Datura stramonium]|uniref:Splicing factor YJU2 n=1 Tax=Datura stramonium TaxID=4076 RepID=A0ABS8S3K7_DATST|nr:hypothetical protein [Datura stramonium]
MGERKVLNKFYPPDFDPAKVPRRKQPKNKQMNVRMMLPMNIRCGTCGNYIYKGTKSNSRKENVVGETYLGIPISRFYLKCTNCGAEIMFKTDPENSDYTVESGNFDPCHGCRDEKEKQKRDAAVELCHDAIKSLETKISISKRQMDMLAASDELISMKSRQFAVSIDAMLERLQQSDEAKNRKTELEDKALIRSVFQGSKIVKRIHDELQLEEDDDLAKFFTSERSESEKNYSVKKRGY